MNGNQKHAKINLYLGKELNCFNMRKFFGILIIAITFFACLFAAIFLAENVAPANIAPVNPNFESSNQLNLLIVVVDQLPEKNPNLISAWSLIFYQNQENGLILLPLSMRYMQNFDQLNEQLRLDSKHNLSSTSINSYQKTFEMKWDANLLIDPDGLSALLSWVSQQQLQYLPADLIALTSNEENTAIFLDNFCGIIESNIMADPEKIDWDQLFPDHFSSPLTKEKLEEIWLSFPLDQTLQCDWQMLIE